MNTQILAQAASILASSVSTAGAATQVQSMLPANAGTDALLFKDDPQFWFEISRLFGAADYGGALFGEVIAIAKNIKSGDYDSWYDANNAFADRLADEADGQMKKGHKISARDNYLRACSCYRSAEFFLHANPDDPRVKRAYERSVASYKASAALFTPAIGPVEIPYEGTTLPGYFHPGDNSGAPRKTLVLNNGFDGSAEEMHWMGARCGRSRLQCIGIRRSRSVRNCAPPETPLSARLGKSRHACRELCIGAQRCRSEEDCPSRCQPRRIPRTAGSCFRASFRGLHLR